MENNKYNNDGFVSKMKVVQRAADHRRTTKKCSRLIQSTRVCMDTAPVVVGETHQTIQIIPIMENGRIKALKASCSCGSESIYDIQYTESEQQNE